MIAGRGNLRSLVALLSLCAVALAACGGDSAAEVEAAAQREAERDTLAESLRDQAGEMCSRLQAATDRGSPLDVSLHDYVREALDDPGPTSRVAALMREECGDLVAGPRELRRNGGDAAPDSEGGGGAPATPNPSGTGQALADDDLDELHQRCADGDMWACDELYMESPWGSAHEAFGASCGERRDDRSAGVFCEDVFGGLDVAPARPLTDEETLIALRISWDQLSSPEQRTMCNEVAKGESAALAAGRTVADASGGLVTTVEATAFLRMAC